MKNGVYKKLVCSQKTEAATGKGVLRNFEKFTEKHLCQSLFFNKVVGPGVRLY